MGGKSNPPPPDYTPLANASKESAEIMAGLGREQLAFSKQQYEEMKPLAEQVAASQIAAQDEQMAQARDYYDYMQTTFRPVEQGLVSQAQQFDTEAYRNQLAQQAAADAARAFGTTQQSTARGLARMGVNPASGAAQSQLNQNALALASSRAGAMTNARQQAEQLGYARKLDAAGLGRGLSGASTAAYGAATGAGSAGLGSAMAPGAAYSQGLAAGASTIGSGRNMLQSGLGNILSTQGSVYSASMQQEDPFASIIGTGLGGWASGGFAGFSDRRLKEKITLVGADDKTGLNIYEFNYIGDERRYRGVMADEVEKVVPEAVATRPDGYKLVNYSMLGIEMVEV